MRQVSGRRADRVPLAVSDSRSGTRATIPGAAPPCHWLQLQAGPLPVQIYPY